MRPPSARSWSSQSSRTRSAARRLISRTSPAADGRRLRHSTSSTCDGRRRRMTTDRAVVLARGLGRRMRAADAGALLDDQQRRAADAGLKGMMPIGSRPFLDYILSSLADAGMREAVLVVAPDHEMVRRRYENEAPPRRLSVTFAVQQEAIGTANAVLAVERWAGSRGFLVLNADNLYPAAVLRALATLDEPGLPAFQRGNLVRSGNIRDHQV